MKRYYKRWLKNLGVWKDFKQDCKACNVDIKKVSYIEELLFDSALTLEKFKYWGYILDTINEFELLIDAVSYIDKKAAKFLKKDLFKKENKHLNPILKSELTSCFTFDMSPQGFDYWDNIYEKLPKELR